ncbi:MAG: RNA polymerase sigma factor [Acidobacteria bacterium]|nr:RNA polymerase sigma factor [Acidobacteriota bacterium]
MEDRGLIARAKAGDEQAFEALMRRFERPVLGLCTRLLGAGGEAEEAAQDVFFRLYRSLDRIDEERAIEPWLFRVAWNACRDRLRRRRPSVELESRHAVQPARGEIGLVLAEVREAVARLPDKERAALLLREVEGLETAEVAERMGTSPVTVRTHISRARVRLREWLGGWQ